jgi:CMP-N,N'-diacetyllegionaminic acid synthase
MRTVAIIPARGGSKGIPGKNLVPFCGRPLLCWSIEHALLSRHVNEVYVTSDSDKILEVSAAAGAKTIKRPDELSIDTASSESALVHALGEIGKVDFVVFLQATSPLREPSDIDGAVDWIRETGADSLFTSALLEDFFIYERRKGKFVSVNFDYQNRPRRQDLKPQYLENGSMYLFKPEVLSTYGNRLGGYIETYVMDMWKSHEIDSREDLELCQWYMHQKILGVLENRREEGKDPYARI